MVKGVLQADVRADVENMGQGEGLLDNMSLPECVQLGDFYACRACQPNQDHIDFYIYQCEEVLHTFTKSFTDGYEVQFKAGDMALMGRWFQPYPGSENKFVFNFASPFSYCHPGEVIHIRFGLTPCEVPKGGKGRGARFYKVDYDTLEAIYESLQV